MAKTVRLHNGEAFTSKRLLVEVLSLPPQGCNFNDMRRRMKVMDAIESADGEIILEDADFDLLKGCFNSFPFRLVHKDIVAIGETLA